MAAKSAQEEIGFPNAETLRAIADAAIELADVIAKSVVTDDPVHSIREKDANDLPVEPVLDKLESLLYVDPPGLAIVAEKVANRNVPWLTQEWPAGWLDHYAVKQAARRLWGTVAGLMVYFGRDPLALGTWDRIDGKFVRRVMQDVEHPPIRTDVIGEDGRVRRADEGLSTAWLGRLRQHAAELRAALPQPASVVVKTATHSPDFRSVNWYGTPHEFTGQQAACVKVLWQAWKNGTPAVGDATVLETAGSDSERLPLVFRNHEAWGTMIVEGQTKGTHRLADSLEA